MAHLHDQAPRCPLKCQCVLMLPLQVINRDLSVAVLRYFVRQRQQEIVDGTLKAPRQKRTPAEAIQLREAGGAGVHSPDRPLVQQAAH